MLNYRRVRQLRRFHDLSMAELAAKVGYSSPNSIWKLEHGKVNVSFAVIEKIAAIFDVTLQELLIDDSNASTSITIKTTREDDSNEKNT